MLSVSVVLHADILSVWANPTFLPSSAFLLSVLSAGAASDEPSAGAAASVAGAAVSAGFSELPHAVSDSAIVAAIANATIFFIIISSLTYCAFLLHNLF